ncbi:hypothetical protein HJFPF1_03621 [Paramyrothecium foliicola]|nr:hypothetical protein HJFPF1_03621 [Paramyrothecium foliicola]
MDRVDYTTPGQRRMDRTVHGLPASAEVESDNENHQRWATISDHNAPVHSSRGLAMRGVIPIFPLVDSLPNMNGFSRGGNPSLQQFKAMSKCHPLAEAGFMSTPVLPNR